MYDGVRKGRQRVKRLRVYIDTSVVGGCLDDEFMEESESFFEMARKGDITLLASGVLADELELAPEEVQRVLGDLPPDCLEAVERSAEAERLRDCYLEAGVVGPARRNDAYHVAVATVADADVLVSWNFRHIVHLDKIRGFNAVNLREGYKTIEIRSPKEVV